MTEIWLFFHKKRKFQKPIDNFFLFRYNESSEIFNDKEIVFMKSLEKLFDIIGEILAVVLVVAWAVLILDANFHFLDEVPVVYNVLSIIRNYGGLVLIAVVGLEAISKRNIVFKIIFLALLALIVVFLFFPDTYNSLIEMIPV